MNVITHLLAADGSIPNHPTWPLLVYPGVLKDIRPEAFEQLFNRNRWPAAWRDGVFPFHHYHSNSHEALGVYAGEVTVQFGGDAGVTLTAKPGDVIVLPAGTGHKRLSSRGALGIVGAYPEGSAPDTCMPPVAGFRKCAQQVAQVPLPSCDPVYGPGGPLFTYWLRPSGR
ncbi:MAG TPA: cupin domain-containing protein [Burkholderiales bacterium]|nr:cupin domain-containing protein [Burkholderiales bacterium]